MHSFHITMLRNRLGPPAIIFQVPKLLKAAEPDIPFQYPLPSEAEGGGGGEALQYRARPIRRWEMQQQVVLFLYEMGT